MHNKKQIFTSLILLFFVIPSAFAQFSSDYSKKEAVEMIAICNSYSFIKAFNSDKNIIPKGYEKVYQSGSIGMDNKWQLWKNDKYAVINLRGSTSEQISWLANIYSAMIPASGEIILPGNESFKYQLSGNLESNVHSGWTLAMAFMAKDIVQHIKMLNYEGVYHFIITGHSQGAAIAQLLRAYLENCPNELVNEKNNFKTYAFASPMVGNIFFVKEYTNQYKTTSFIINNPSDFISQTPFTIDKNNMLNPEDINTIIDTNKSIFKTLAIRAAGKILFSNPDSAYIEKAGSNVHMQIIKNIGPFSMPDYQLDMTYTPMENPILIGPFVEQDFIKKKTYKKFDFDAEQSFYQHKSYLYYLDFLKRNFPNDFKRYQ